MGRQLKQINVMKNLNQIQDAIVKEMDRADEKFGEQVSVPSVSPDALKRADLERRVQWYGIPSMQMAKNTTDYRTQQKNLSWADIAVEELSEIVCAKDDAERREELIQLAAVCQRWIRKIDEDKEKASKTK